ncbi:MAG: VanW family protein [Clostridiales bacterium]|nr:VanW family protein [Clostridiales bacterium]
MPGLSKNSGQFYHPALRRGLQSLYFHRGRPGRAGNQRSRRRGYVHHPARGGAPEPDRVCGRIWEADLPSGVRLRGRPAAGRDPAGVREPGGRGRRPAHRGLYLLLQNHHGREQPEPHDQYRRGLPEAGGGAPAPGGRLDFNADIGPYRASEGYMPAGVLVEGELQQGYGGGTCQVSSTLYNVVLQLPGLTVLQRRAHGDNGASYLPIGVDAAVGNSTLNFRFRNDYDFPIRIDGYSQDGALTIAIYRTE